MSFFSDRFAPLALAFSLGACGFHPLYGGAGSGPGGALASIAVEPIPERVGYELRNNLIDLLNAKASPQGAAYRLKITYREESVGVAIRPNASITRYNYTLIAHYDLFPAGSTTPEKSGDVRSLTAYNVASSPYATVTVSRDADNRAVRDVAERVRTELAVYFRARAGANGS